MLETTEWERAPGQVRSLQWLLGEQESQDEPRRVRKARWFAPRTERTAFRR
jgi:hypothetical protein